MARCRNYRTLMGACVDGTASEAERAELRRHLDECAECARQARELESVRRLVAGLPVLRPPVGLRPALAARLRAQRVTWFDRLFGGMRPSEVRLAATVALLLIVAIGAGAIGMRGFGPTVGPESRIAADIPPYALPAAAASAPPTDEYLQACGLAHGTLDQDQAYWGVDSVQLASYVR